MANVHIENHGRMDLDMDGDCYDVRASCDSWLSVSEYFCGVISWDRKGSAIIICELGSHQLMISNTVWIEVADLK